MLMAPIQNDTYRVLKRARNLIEHTGWCRGSAHERTLDSGFYRVTAYCSLAAINDAAVTLDVSGCNARRLFAAVVHHSLVLDFSRYLYFKVEDWCMISVLWNDRPSRTKAEVLAAFDRACERALAEVPA